MPYNKDVDLAADNLRERYINYLEPNNFKFEIDRVTYENVGFMVQSANVPDITLDFAVFNTPFKISQEHADKVQYAPLAITFLVDEKLTNYLEIHDWLMGQLHYNTELTKDFKLRDIKLTIMSSHNNPLHVITFRDAFPMSLSQMTFDSRASDIEYVTADVMFAYTYFEVETLNK